MSKRQQAVEFFLKSGWSLAQSCGVVANLEAESGLRPDAVGDKGTAYGLPQWRGERQSHFEALLGKPLKGSSFEDQLYFVHAELRHVGWESKAGDALAQCNTAAEAAEVICRLYERPADPDGDSRKRALLAQQIYNEALIPPAAENAPQLDPMPIPANPTGSTMLPAMLLPLLQEFVLPMLAPRVATAVSKVTQQPPEVSGKFVTDFFGKLMEVTGKPDPVQAAAALQTGPVSQVKEVEEHALDYIDKLAPVIDKLHQMSKDEWAADEDSMASAAARNATDGFDLARPLVYGALMMIGILVAFVCSIIVVQTWKLPGHSPTTEVWAALTGIIGWVTGVGTTIYAFRFGSTRSSAAKDVTISNIAQRGTGK